MKPDPRPGHYTPRRSWPWRSLSLRATCPNCSRPFTRRVRGGWAGYVTPLMSLICPHCGLWNTYAPQTQAE